MTHRWLFPFLLLLLARGTAHAQRLGRRNVDALPVRVAIWEALVLDEIVMDSTCLLGVQERRRVLALPFREFDQSTGGGWRALYAKKCYDEAAELLVAYMGLHPQVAKEQYILPFHAGQMFALGGRYAEAIGWMERGYSDTKSEIINWNAFVDANIAFLKGDRTGLLKQRELVNQQPVLQAQPGMPEWAVGKKMNLDVVDGFLACFDKTYEVAYSDSCRGRSSQH